MVLTRTRLFGPEGYPVVELDRPAMDWRVRTAAHPVLKLAAAADLAEQLRPERVPSAVHLVGFIGIYSSPKSVRSLAVMRGQCRTMLVAPPGRLREPVLSELDYLGITAATVDGDDAVSVVVLGDPGPRRGSDPHPTWVRLREEQLFDLVMRSDSERLADSADVSG